MKAVGQLDHPNIVQATDAGEADGSPYLVMELVDGIDLSKLVQRLGPLPVPDACELARQAALGLEHAHTHGMVHRDIKPSNLLLARSGQVKVLDLGLALLLPAEHPSIEPLTGPGQVMGTFRYVAPEQIAATHAVDIRVDIYSLGCTLYKLLTGELPHEPSITARAGAKPGLERALASIRERRPDVSEKLLGVIARMIAYEPVDRFKTPADVARALEPFVPGCDLRRLVDAVSAERDSQFQLPASLAALPRWPNRLRARRVLLASLLGGILAVAAAVFVWPERGWSILWRSALSLGTSRPNTLDDEQKAPIVFETTRLVGDDSSVRRVAFLPDGDRVITASEDGTIRLWDIHTASEVRVPTGHVGRVLALAVSRDGKNLLTGGEDSTVRVQNLETGDESQQFPGDGAAVTGVAFCDERDRIVSTTSVGEAGTVRIWDTKTGNVVRRFETNAPLWFPVFSSDGRRLVASSGGKRFRVWNLDTGEQLQIFEGHTDRIRCVAISSDLRFAVSGSDDKTVRIWDIETARQLHCLRAHQGAVLAIAISPDGRRLLSGSVDNSVRLWDFQTGRQICILTGHTDPVRSVFFSLDNRRAVSGSDDHTARLWAVPE